MLLVCLTRNSMLVSVCVLSHIIENWILKVRFRNFNFNIQRLKAQLDVFNLCPILVFFLFSMAVMILAYVFYLLLQIDAMVKAKASAPGGVRKK